MKLKITVLLIILSIAFSGCERINLATDLTETPYAAIDTSSLEPAETPADIPETQSQQTETTAPDETTVPATVETTAPDLSLDIVPGRYQLQFVCEQTGDYLDYHLFIPNNPVKGMPLITFLHGMGEVGQIDVLKDYGIATITKELYGDDFPYILLIPCTHERTWIKNEIPVTLKALIDHIVSELYIDTEHVILTGHSLGAIGTWKMISLYADYFSAAVPVSCGIDDPLNYTSFHNIPVWGFVGTDGYYEENYNKAMVKIVDAVNENGGNAVLTIYEGVEHTETVTLPYTRELFDWMLAQ